MMRYVVILLVPLFFACVYPPVAVETPNQTASVIATPLDCAVGAMGVHTPADLRCYLKQFDPRLVRKINEEITVLIFPATAGAEWIGGANIYHIPTVSTVTLDRTGYVDPAWTIINTPAAWASLWNVLMDAVLMEELRQAVAAEWQIADPAEITLKIGTAYQDGNEIVFLWSLVGLDANDDRFYCPGEEWNIGDDLRVSVIAMCTEFQPPTGRVGHLEYQLQQSEQKVQLFKGNDLRSNVITVIGYP